MVRFPVQVLGGGGVMMTALIRLAAALVVAPVVASAQPAFQPPPAAFQTPSGNVHCGWDAGALRCTVEHTEAPPAAALRCATPWPGALLLRAAGATEVACQARARGSEEDFVLGYGARWIAHGITCESDESGLACTNQAGHGFRASRARVELF